MQWKAFYNSISIVSYPHRFTPRAEDGGGRVQRREAHQEIVKLFLRGKEGGRKTSCTTLHLSTRTAQSRLGDSPV